MTQVEKIKAEIERLKNELIQEVEKGCKSEFDEGRISAFEDMITFIDSLEEEPVSEDLEEAARRIATRHSHITGDTYYANDAWFFKKGAQWQKDKMMEDAVDGEIYFNMDYLQYHINTEPLTHSHQEIRRLYYIGT